MVHSSLQGFTGPAGVVLDAPVRSGPELLGPANRPGPPGVTPADRPSPRELIQQRNVRWVRVRPSLGCAGVTALFKRHARDRRRIPPGHTHGFSSDQRHSSRRFQAAASRPREAIFRSGPSKSVRCHWRSPWSESSAGSLPRNIGPRPSSLVISDGRCRDGASLESSARNIWRGCCWLGAW